MDQQIKALQAQSAANASLRSDVLTHKQEVKHLDHDIHIKHDMFTLKLAVAPPMPPSFHADWQLVFDFFMRNTTPLAPPLVDNTLKQSVPENSSEVKKLAVGLSNVLISSSPLLTSSLFTSGGPNWIPGALAVLDTQVQELKACLSSKLVLIGAIVFPTLPGSCAWGGGGGTANLPSNPDQANICMDAMALLDNIGCEFDTVDETWDTTYQNKRAGVPTISPTVASSLFTLCFRKAWEGGSTISDLSGEERAERARSKLQ